MEQTVLKESARTGRCSGQSFLVPPEQGDDEEGWDEEEGQRMRRKDLCERGRKQCYEHMSVCK